MIERERILELPLPARNVTNLIIIGGRGRDVGQSPSWGMATGVNIAVAGGQRFGVDYMLDGAEHTNRFDQTGMPMPFPDSLQEFRVSTSTQEAGTGARLGRVGQRGHPLRHQPVPRRPVLVRPQREVQRAARRTRRATTA